MNIAVMGSGNGGCAIAFDCGAHGHKVRLGLSNFTGEELEKILA